MAVTGDNLRINGDRLWDSIHELAEIGPGIAGGSNRQTLTDDDKQGRELFQRWCTDAGMSMGLDQMGTMFARREGEEPGLDPVYIGSHLDTQPTGGRYDGVLGVLSGLEVIRTLNELGIKTRRPIVVVNWTNEEGARFAPAMLASGVFAGVHTLDYAYGRKDPDGKTFGDELKRIGWVGDELVGSRKMHSYFEYHIEQGPILEAENKTIGIVTAAMGQRWYELTFEGVESHAGPTPMNRRKDALPIVARHGGGRDRRSQVWHHDGPAELTGGVRHDRFEHRAIPKVDMQVDGAAKGDRVHRSVSGCDGGVQNIHALEEVHDLHGFAGIM